MTVYLAIITTVLVITQIVRVTQNAIQLHRQEQAIKRDLAWLKDNNITERDFEVQRSCFYLLREWLERELEADLRSHDEFYEGNEYG